MTGVQGNQGAVDQKRDNTERVFTKIENGKKELVKGEERENSYREINFSMAAGCCFNFVKQTGSL